MARTMKGSEGSAQLNCGLGGKPAPRNVAASKIRTAHEFDD
jgi:hypothetical protein